MMTGRRSGLLAAMLLLAAIPARGQSPCTDPPPTGVLLNPSKIYVTLEDQNAVLPDGSPVVTEYQLGYFVNTAMTPVQIATIPKANLIPVPGTTNCYTGTPAGLASVPVGPTTYTAAMKARRVPATGDPEESGWSFPSNPFGRTAAPPAPSRVVVR